jgi:hypothetical protein
VSKRGSAWYPVKQCWAKDGHTKGCRVGRPKCRWRRPPPCHCMNYPFPHRLNSGLCGKHEAMNLMVYGPPPEQGSHE